ncbi:MAG: rhodanese-like domain-containing protein [Anaerolineae bacterium]|nr:rhodanese-like domain-containing protein [Chloroflexi bacterium CFX2]MCQ3945094.1 rhodanese-like domain-containing protein [Anaerolineae bacterium]
MESVMKKIVLLAVFLLVVLTACQGESAQVTGETVTVAGGSYQNVMADDLNAMLKNKDFVFVNVHIPFAGNIAGTDLSIPYDQIADPANLSQLPADKNAKIVLYCRSGRMSTIAVDELVSLGYTNVWNLTGGMVDWENAGYEIEQ